MPRKQRFKPSRKPKAVGTQTDFPPLERAAPLIEPATLQEQPAIPEQVSPEKPPPEDLARTAIDYTREPN